MIKLALAYKCEHTNNFSRENRWKLNALMTHRCRRNIYFQFHSESTDETKSCCEEFQFHWNLRNDEGFPFLSLIKFDASTVDFLN